MDLYMSYYSVLPHYRLTHDISLDLISSDVESDNNVNNTNTWSKSTSEKITYSVTCTGKDGHIDKLIGKTSSEILTSDNVNWNYNNNSCSDSPKQKCHVKDESSKSNYSPKSKSNNNATVASDNTPGKQPSLNSTTVPSNLNCSLKKKDFSFINKTGLSQRDLSSQSMVHLNMINKSADTELNIKQDYYKSKKKDLEYEIYPADNRLQTDLGSPQEITLEIIDKSLQLASPVVEPTEISALYKTCDEAKVIENVQRNMRKRANNSKKGKRPRKLPQTTELENSPEALLPPPDRMTKSLAEELLDAHNKEENEGDEDDQNDQLSGLTSMHDSFYGGKLGTCEDERDDDEEFTQMSGEMGETGEWNEDGKSQVENLFLEKTASYNENCKESNETINSGMEKSECIIEKQTANVENEQDMIRVDENFFLRRRSDHSQSVKSDHQRNNYSSLTRSVSESNSVCQMTENNELRITSKESPRLSLTTTNMCNKDIVNTDCYENNATGHSDIGSNKNEANVRKNSYSLDEMKLDCHSLVRELSCLSENVEYIDDDPGDNPKCRQLSEMMTLNFNTTSETPKKAFLSSDNSYLQTDTSLEEKMNRKSTFLDLLGRKSSTDSNNENDSGKGSSPRSSLSDDDWDMLDATHRGCHKFIPRHADEMSIEIGDPLHVFCEADDMWCEGLNLRSKQKGVFPSVYATDLEFLEGEGETRKLAKFTLHFLGSVEVNYHKGNDVICQAMQKVIMSRRMTHNSVSPSLCCLEITEYGIKMINKSKKQKRQSTLPKNNSIKQKIAKILSKDREGSDTNEQFFSLKNISYCGNHPRNDHYFAFITKHPLEMRFACHVFVAEFSTRPICAAFGRAFKKFYQEYMAFAHPTEDIYME